MRIIGQIEHPVLKITVFRSDNRISVKFENEGYEQTYKLGADERLSDVEAIRKWADPLLLEEILARMQQMHRGKLSALLRVFPPDGSPEFEDII
ncbi:MAG: hypothetical protein L6Q97_20685 [Thermoanaerobaculia bacterium]|nr:hypothetical protein [Thermoanaerobaculia bacterium]